MIYRSRIWQLGGDGKRLSTSQALSKYPFPILINSAFLKLADVFQSWVSLFKPLVS